MPRLPRIQLDGVPLHIVQRGHNREPCFFGEEDYAKATCTGWAKPWARRNARCTRMY